MKNHLLLCLLALMGAQAQAQNPYESWFPRKYRFTRLSDYCTYTGSNETATYEYDSQGRKVSETREPASSIFVPTEKLNDIDYKFYGKRNAMYKDVYGKTVSKFLRVNNICGGALTVAGAGISVGIGVSEIIMGNKYAGGVRVVKSKNI